MTDLPFDFSDTLEAFECPDQITAYEKTGSYVNGRWTETKGAERQINCILLNVDETKQEIMAEGRNVVGAYCMMFPEDRDELFFTLQQNNTIQAKQSYVLIDGLEYIVVNNPGTRKNAGFRSYYALRFKDQVNVAADSQ